MESWKPEGRWCYFAEVTAILHFPWSWMQIRPLRRRRQNTNETIGFIGVSEVRFTGNLGFHWNHGFYTFSWNSMDFHEIPWNSTDFTKIRDFHWSCHFIRRCEGSRNLSIPIGLLMFSRRGREGSALVEGKHDFLHISGDFHDLWWFWSFSL